MESETIKLNEEELKIITKLDEDIKEEALKLEDTIDLSKILEQTQDLSNEIINNNGGINNESSN